MSKITAAFVEPMLCFATVKLPEGDHWQYELKLDGYRALAFKSHGRVQLRSRNNKDFTARYGAVVDALRNLPDETLIDGEVVAFDDSGHPSFNELQNFGSSNVPIFYYAFDLLIYAGTDIRSEPLETRRELLRTDILPKLSEPIRYSPELEGLIAKRRDSRYESGDRSGAWLKMRVNQGQEFVIGGYTLGGESFDALIFGYYEEGKLIYAGRTRNGFTPAIREQLFKRFRGLQTTDCPFANLPEEKSGRWGVGLTAAKMKDCRWLKPQLVGQFEYAEWTPDAHLRHSRFVAVRDGKLASEVAREE